MMLKTQTLQGQAKRMGHTPIIYDSDIQIVGENRNSNGDSVHEIIINELFAFHFVVHTRHAVYYGRYHNMENGV
jgi:hypothetical protein